MTTSIIDHNQDTAATSQRYRYTRVAEIGGHTVRARIQRSIYLNDSGAIAEIRIDGTNWSTLTAEPINNWWYDTPQPSPDIDAAAVLGPLADTLVRHAAEILAAPPAMPCSASKLLVATLTVSTVSAGEMYML